MSEIDNKSLEERKAAWLNEGNSNEQDQEDNQGDQHADDIESDQPLLGDIIDLEKLSSPLLTILAIEEPENHLSPHYLGKIMDGLDDLAGKPNAQVVITSHSPSILSRVEPDYVRYLKHDISKRVSHIRSIPIPDKEEEAEKFIREAVRTYPELYFARCVILGEGASEEIVLRKILRAYGLSSDRQFISIVPLGGRHINHLWKLLSALHIPFFTLIDLDLGRELGGVDRLKSIAEELKNIDNPLKHISRETGKEVRTKLPDSIDDPETLKRWIDKFKPKKIYLSAPLDLDLSLLKSYQDAYKKIEIRGPSIPKKGDENYEEKLGKVIESVLGIDGNDDLYSKEELHLFWRYRYHFLSKSKPTSHLLALNTLTDDELRENCPENLKELIEAITRQLDIDLLGESE